MRETFFPAPGPGVHVHSSPCDPEEQWRVLRDAEATLAFFPAPEGGWHVVVPSRNEDGVLRLTRGRRALPDASARRQAAALRASALDEVLRARLHPRASDAPRTALSEAVEGLFSPRRAAPGWAAAALAGYPQSLHEDTPEQVELAVNGHLLEALYERLAWGDDAVEGRKRQGSFHTPTRLAWHMARESLAAFVDPRLLYPQPRLPRFGDPRAALRDLRALRIVDPSVGPGSFLVAVADLILRAAALLGGGLSARHVLTRMVHGVDTSELALATCRARLGLLALAHGGRADDADDAPLARGNSLVDDGQFAWKKSFPGVFARGGFDLAIGNPPYLRDSRKKDMPADLASRYRAATSHYDLYTLFMERSLEVVREGGRICLLTSNRYLVQKYGEGIRRLLLEHELEEVTDLDFRTFEAGVTTCITTARKAAPGPRATARLARVTAEEALPARHAPPGDVPQAVAAKVPLSWLRGLERAAFRIGLDPARVALAERLAEGAARFSDLGFVTLGMVFHDPREGGARKADYLSHERRPPFDAPLVDGEHVERWRFNGKLWLRYAPDEHREPRFPELFASPKLVCRRIIGRARIMACVDEGGTYFSDNTVGFVPYHALRDCSARAVRARANKAARGSGFDLYYLAALLNSRLLTWYYRTMLGFGVHFYPAHLKALPAREADAPTARALAALAREASRARDTRDLDREIDRLVERLYEVTPRESALIGGG